MSPKKDLSEEDRFDIAVQCHQGVPHKEIAKEYRVAVKTVVSLAEQLNDPKVSPATFYGRKKKNPRKKKAPVKMIQNPALGNPCAACGVGTMVPKISRKKQSEFLGCSNFPSCRNTLPIEIPE